GRDWRWLEWPKWRVGGADVPSYLSAHRHSPPAQRSACMFESPSEKLSGILDKLTGPGALPEEDLNAAMREVRCARLEADVALEVVRSFVDRTRTKAVGAAVIKSVKPGQMVVKIVHDSLVETLGGESQAIDLNAPAPVAIMLVGLQGAGKTTS